MTDVFSESRWKERKPHMVRAAVIISLTMTALLLFACGEPEPANSNQASPASGSQPSPAPAAASSPQDSASAASANSNQASSTPGASNSNKGSTTASTSKKRIAVIETSLGTIKFELLEDEAPKTAENFELLAK